MSVTIEIAGCPGSGKTTLACRLAAELGRLDCPVRTALSLRSEEGADMPSGSYLLAKALQSARGALLRRDDPVGTELLKRLPIGLKALRRRRYLAALASRSRDDGVLIEDQGYVCALAGLLLDSGRTDPNHIARALDWVPRPDIVAFLEVPSQVATDRLKDRHQGQSRLKQRLERAPSDNHALHDIFQEMAAQLSRRGCRVLRFRSVTEANLTEAIDGIVTALTDKASSRPASVAK